MTDLEWMKITTESDNEDLLNLLLDDAEESLLAYTNRTTLPSELTVCKRRWALIAFNRRGMEGETSRSEGGISASFAEIPAELAGIVNRYRLARVGGATFEKEDDSDEDEAVG